MTVDHQLLQAFRALNADRTLTTEEYFSRQKALLKEGIALLKESQHKDVDYVVGSIALHEGDKYGISVKSALGHLNRSYKNGSIEAGLGLSDALRGVYTQVPEEFVNKEKSLQILNDLNAAGSSKVTYGLSAYYLDQIVYTIEGGGHAPDEWFDLTYKYASQSADAGFIGGYTMLGYLHSEGFGNDIPQNPKESFIYYQKAIDTFSGNLEEEGFLSDAKFHIGSYYYNGFGVARDRKKGLALIIEAADLGQPMAQEWLGANHDLLVKEGLIGDEDQVIYEESFDDLDFHEEQVPVSGLKTGKDTQTRH